MAPSAAVNTSTNTSQPFERSTLCIPSADSHPKLLQCGSPAFAKVQSQHYTSPEAVALDSLIKLKHTLRRLSHCDDFWKVCVSQSAQIVGAQLAMVSKKMSKKLREQGADMEVLKGEGEGEREGVGHKGEESGQAEKTLPPLGEPGSMLLGTAFWLNGGKAENTLLKDYVYPAYGSPCQHMAHAKTLLIPSNMPSFITDNPNTLPWERSEAFMGIPLYRPFASSPTPQAITSASSSAPAGNQNNPPVVNGDETETSFLPLTASLSLADSDNDNDTATSSTSHVENGNGPSQTQTRSGTGTEEAFAHLAFVWSEEGMKKPGAPGEKGGLGWPMVECVMLALEDLVVGRLVWEEERSWKKDEGVGTE